MSIRIDGTNTTANPGTTGADADTGLVYGSNEVKIVTGGTDRVKVDSSGRLLVGTTNAVAFGSRQVLAVANGTTGGVISLYNSTTATANTRISSNPTGSEINDIGIHAASTNGSIIAYTNNDTEALRIDSSGKVYFGNFGDVANAGYIDKATTGDKELNIVASRSTAQNRNIVFKGRSNTEAMRIDSAGRVGIGTTTPTFTAGSGLHIAGSSGALKLQNTNNGDWAYVEYADESNTTKFIQGYRDQSGVYGIRPGASLSSTSGISLDSSGNVSIGSSTFNLPSGKGLQVYDSTTPRFKLANSTTGTGSGDGSLLYVSGSDFLIENKESANMRFYTAATERMRIDSSGKVGIGTSNPSYKLVISNGGAAGLEISPNQGEGGGAFLQSFNRSSFQFVPLTYYSNAHVFLTGTGTSQTERLRIDSAGRLLVGTTNTSPVSANVAGTMINSDGETHFSRSNGTTVLINRKASDGTLVQFWQDGTAEGTISVSGTTVSYNGGHLSRWSQLPGGVERTEILRGSVLSNLDEMCEWGEEDNEQLNRMKVSDAEGDVNVSGVFQAWDDDDNTYTNDFYCAMTGDFVIRIAQGTTVARGDLLMSAGDGTAKPQDDDIVRSKTIAKVTSTTVSETYADGSYCIPCVLMAC